MRLPAVARLIAVLAIVALLAPGLTELVAESLGIGDCADDCEADCGAGGDDGSDPAHCCTGLLRGCACAAVSPVEATATTSTAPHSAASASAAAMAGGGARDGFTAEIFRPPAA